MGKLRGARVRWKKNVKNERYECDQGEKRNPIGKVSNNGANRIQTFFFYSCGVILRSEEYYNDEIPKFLVGRNV
jgi:hypothetical protein